MKRGNLTQKIWILGSILEGVPVFKDIVQAIKNPIHQAFLVLFLGVKHSSKKEYSWLYHIFGDCLIAFMHIMYPSARAALTKHHILSNLHSRHLFCIVLEAGRFKMKGPAYSAPGGGSSWPADWGSASASSLCPHMASSEPKWAPWGLFLRTLNPVKPGPHQCGLIKPYYLLRGPVSKYSHTGFRASTCEFGWGRNIQSVTLGYCVSAPKRSLRITLILFWSNQVWGGGGFAWVYYGGIFTKHVILCSLELFASLVSYIGIVRLEKPTH